MKKIVAESLLVLACALMADSAISFSGESARALLAGVQVRLLPVIRHVDLQRYAGTWYEIASLPNPLQFDCVRDTTMRFELKPNGHMAVFNRCTTADGVRDAVHGVARHAETAVNPDETGVQEGGRLEVRFVPRWLAWLPGAWGDYGIIGIDADYRVALVGTADRDYLWLLSRSPDLPEAQIATWLEKAKALGFAGDMIVRTPQTPLAGAAPAAPSL